MNPSQNCLDFISKFEGCRTVAYQDQKGIWTIGFGHISGVTPGMTCTMEEALGWLSTEVNKTGEYVTNLVTIGLNQNQFDALVSFAYNVGVGSLSSSTLLKEVNEGNFSAAAEQFLVWDHCNGQVDLGLLRRRQAERELFLS